MDNPQTITIATVNVNVIGLKGRRDKTLKTLREYNADVIFLQETHTARITEWQGLSYCSFGTKNSSGSAILFHRELGFSVEEQSSDCDWRVASVRGIMLVFMLQITLSLLKNFFLKSFQSFCQ